MLPRATQAEGLIIIYRPNEAVGLVKIKENLQLSTDCLKKLASYVKFNEELIAVKYFIIRPILSQII